jgi:nitric oxide reductase NorQ protein/cobaltochelatase CobS
VSIALFVQTDSDLVTDESGQAGLNQSIIVPNYIKGVVEVYHRVSTGKRGRSESWEVTPIEALPQNLVSNEPVAIRLTDNDNMGISMGKVTTLAIKSITAFENSGDLNYSVTHADLVSDLVSRIEASDSTLGEYLTDSRYNDKAVIIPPLSAKAEIVVNEPVKTLVASGVKMDLATVPDSKWAKEYINRKIVGDTNEFAIFDVAMREHESVLIKGHAGSGKTMSVLAYASSRGYRYYNVSSHIGVEPSQLFGKFNPTEDGHFRWQDGAVTDLVRNGGVLLLNEVNFLPERVTTVLFSLLDHRREIQLMDKDGEVVKAHPDLLIIADMNPAYRGTRELNQAWNDRFDHKLDFPYDPSIEKKLISNTAVLDMANQLRDRFEAEELSTPISTRSLVAFMKSITNLGLDYAIYSYLNSFPLREQAPVRLVIDTYRHNIEVALGITSPVIEDTEEVIEPDTNQGDFLDTTTIKLGTV